jgi:hypothetical protein
MMNDPERLNADQNRWRRLCAQVVDERDPQRISDLLDQLLKELDARRQTDRENGKVLDGDSTEI